MKVVHPILISDGILYLLDFNLKVYIFYSSYHRGQAAPTGNSPPPFGPSLKLDFELEMVATYAIV